MLTLPRTSRSRRALDLARRQEAAVAAGQRRGVDAERHPQGRLVDRQAGQRARVGRVGDGVADGDLGQAGHGHDVARPRLVDLDELDAAGRGQRGDGAAERDDPARLDPSVGRLGFLAQDA